VKRRGLQQRQLLERACLCRSNSGLPRFGMLSLWAVSDETLTRDDVMTERGIPECQGEDVLRIPGSPAPFGAFDGGVNPGLPSERRSPGESTLDILWRCTTRQNLTGASLPQIRRGLARAWHLMLASQIDEALGAIERIELQRDDVSPAVTKRLRAATQLLRAAGLAAGLYQVFLAGGEGSGMLLRRAYDHAEAPGLPDRDVLPFVGSLLARWEARHAKGHPVQSTSSINDALTTRERDILDKISQGLPNKRSARPNMGYRPR
jgi:hypothetical protein